MNHTINHNNYNHLRSVRCDHQAIQRIPSRVHTCACLSLASKDNVRSERHPQVRLSMTDTSLATSPLQSLPPVRKTKTLTVTRKVRTAIEAMVWQGLQRRDAAQIAGLTEHSLYVALRSPHVKQFYLSQLDVLRTSERARNIHRAVEIREQTSNQMASIQAIKLLEQISDDAPASRGSVSLPGLVIVVNTGAPLTQPPTIDADMKVISE